MLQLKWFSKTITTNKQANEMIRLVQKLKPKIGSMDTESDGLNIILSRPFVFQFGFVHPTREEGYTYAVDIERQPKLAKAIIKAWYKLMEDFDIVLGHNIKFDMHMVANIGIYPKKENLSDTMFYIRYAHDALHPSQGGPPLKLKDYATRFIDPRAKDHEKKLKAEQSAIAKELNLKLKLRLQGCGKPPEKYGAHSYTLGVIKEIFKDPIVDYTDLPEPVKTAYLEWLHQDVPIYLQHKITGLVEPDMISYNVLNRENLIKYAHYDIIYTLETYLKTKPIVLARENMRGVEIEDSLLFPLFEMERVGFKVNKEYIEEARIKLKKYIQERRAYFYDLAGREIKVGQHAVIKDILCFKFDVVVPSTNSDILDRVHSDLIRERGAEADSVKFIEVIQELRTLEKWYSTYILRFLRELKRHNRLYTQINQVGTVSGRVTSDFQQFPKKAIKTIDGEELFHPRKMVVPTGGEYNAIVYLDYSQIELRIQALYTILVGYPDLNLCRAYMPYKCIDGNGSRFDYNNPTHIQRWNESWYLEEDKNTLWSPVDVHGATTTEATGLQPGDKGFKEARSKIGKPVNFGKNYGAQYNCIRQMFPEKTDEEIKRIDEAYYKAFPGVRYYHQYCYNRAMEYSYTVNLFGVKYYNVSGHKLINLLIQGSAAYLLKLKIRELYDYCKAKNIKSRFQMNIHDELSWERHTSELEVFFDFQKIMQKWDDTLVPIVAEMEVTKDNWAEKKEVGTLDELRSYLSS